MEGLTVILLTIGLVTDSIGLIGIILKGTTNSAGRPYTIEGGNVDEAPFARLEGISNSARSFEARSAVLSALLVLNRH